MQLPLLKFIDIINKPMKIFREIKSNLITQLFGKDNTKENTIAFYNELGLLGHNGWDFYAYSGEPIYFGCDIKGEVVAIYNDDPINEGIGVDIITNDKDGIFQHRYWHLKSVACKLGAIESGDLIGYCDNTGRYTTGTHLHRDLKPLIIENGQYKNKFQQNGYWGCVDLQPYYVPVFIKDQINILKKQISLLQKIIDLFKLIKK